MARLAIKPEHEAINAKIKIVRRDKVNMHVTTDGREFFNRHIAIAVQLNIDKKAK